MMALSGNTIVVLSSLGGIKNIIIPPGVMEEPLRHQLFGLIKLFENQFDEVISGVSASEMKNRKGDPVTVELRFGEKTAVLQIERFNDGTPYFREFRPGPAN